MKIKVKVPEREIQDSSHEISYSCMVEDIEKEEKAMNEENKKEGSGVKSLSYEEM